MASCCGIDRAATKRLGKTLASGGDKQATGDDSGTSASVDDEANMEMEVEGSVKIQAEQAAEASR